VFISKVKGLRMETNFCDHGSLREFICELFPIT